ncbi:hypothetical protein [Paenibacillus sp. 276b]|uniref:hypothetical protein n=1 Tax=Paenibacillus sp. 276b TaxID=1566277 RepID=UPI00089BFD9E|nr:hypothetical protein [Paenibacillus sp. 276b]SEA82401.1 hypothetical protein SAMN03159332_2688 [Paenibacillus sp. 276b]
MVPTIGDIYCVYVESLQQYAACQVTDLKETGSKGSRQLAAILQLDWTGDQPPDETELLDMKPLSCNYYFWKGTWDHSFVNAEVPPHYVLAGNRAPLITEETRSYSAGWQIGESLYRQHQWDAIDESRREHFKQAAEDYSEIPLGDAMVRKNTSILRNFRPTSAEDVVALAQFPCLTHIEMRGYTEDIIPFLEQNPFIYELHIHEHGQTALDLSKTHLTKLVLDMNRVNSLTLHSRIEFLSFMGDVSPDLHVNAYEKGHRMTLNVAATVPQITALSRLGGLYVREITELDLQPVVHTYPELSELRLWGKPGNVSNIQSIQQLTSLQTLSINDLFGFKGEDFPGPEQLPELSTLRLTSLPSDAAKSIKANYKKAAQTRIDLKIGKPRKPEWLAENLNNPFRDWDGRDHIKAAYAKKAAQTYKQHLKEIRRLSQNMSDLDLIQKQLMLLVEKYTETFNQMEAKANFIETIEREEIYNALVELLDQLESQPGIDQTSAIKVNRKELDEVFEHRRDF